MPLANIHFSISAFFILCCLLTSCVSSSTEGVSNTDSTAHGVDEKAGEGVLFTIKEDIAENPTLINERKKSLRDYLIDFYAPDKYTPYAAEDSVKTPAYIVTGARVIEGLFFAGQGKCDRRSLFLTGRGNFVDQEYYDLFFLSKKTNGEIKIDGKETFPGSEGQSSTIVDIEKEALSVDKNCFVLKVTSFTEGGDINLHKDKWVEYYIADADNFHQVLKLQLEETNITDYEVTQDKNQNSSSAIREIEILATHSNGLRDIKVRFTSSENGSSVTNTEEVYAFDGEEYLVK